MHVDNQEVTKIIQWMKGVYVSHMRDSHGKNHDYLSMELDLLVDGKVRVMMTDYPRKFVYGFYEIIHGRVKTPAAEHLFTERYKTDKKLLGK